MARNLIPNRRNTAVSLAEAVIALGLGVVVVLVAIALGITSLRSNQKGADFSIGSNWAASVLDNFVYGLPPSSDSFWATTSFATPYQTDTIHMGSTTFQSELFLTDLGAVGAGSKLVTVNVTWGSGEAGRTGQGRQVTAISRLVYAH